MWAVEDQETTDDMALRNEDKDWIASEIRKSADAITAALKPRGFAYLVFCVQKLGPPIAAIGVVVALLTITAGAIYQSNSHVKEETEFRTNTKRDLKGFGEQLTGIESTLRTLQAVQFPKKVLQELATLDKEAFAKNLPALRKVAEQNPKDLAISGGTLREVAQKLDSADESTPGYWPTVLQFLRFASAGNSSGVPPPGIPNLTIRESRLSLGTVRDRIVLLDGGELQNTRFEHSRIIFTNDPVKLNGVLFVGCVFEVPVTDNPSPFLKKASRQLLASNLQSVSPILP